MTTPRIWVDFMKTDAQRRVVLTTLGTQRDLRAQGIDLREGLTLEVYSDDADDAGRPDHLLVSGVVQYDRDTERWVLEIDWDAIRHESDLGPS